MPRKFTCYIIFAVNLLLCSTTNIRYLENFATNGSINDWKEHSDTIRDVGKSKSSLVLQKTDMFERAILFTLLNPQPCGAAFTGYIKIQRLDLTPYDSISLKVRGQGEFRNYEFVLMQTGEKSHFCNFFEAPAEFDNITVRFDAFKPYFEGKEVENSSIKLNKAGITAFGILSYGGVYMPRKQSGVASLEIDWISVQ